MLIVDKFSNLDWAQTTRVATATLEHIGRFTASQSTLTADQAVAEPDWLIQNKEGIPINSSMGHLWQGDTYPIGYRYILFETTLIGAVEP